MDNKKQQFWLGIISLTRNQVLNMVVEEICYKNLDDVSDGAENRDVQWRLHEKFFGSFGVRRLGEVKEHVIRSVA